MRREKLTGIASLLRYASRVGSGAELYPSSPVDATCAALLVYSPPRIPARPSARIFPTHSSHIPILSPHALRSLVDQWVDFACASITSGVTFEPTLAALDAYLSTRTFFVGHSITLADVAVW